MKRTIPLGGKNYVLRLSPHTATDDLRASVSDSEGFLLGDTLSAATTPREAIQWAKEQITNLYPTT